MNIVSTVVTLHEGADARLQRALEWSMVLLALAVNRRSGRRKSIVGFAAVGTWLHYATFNAPKKSMPTDSANSRKGARRLGIAIPEHIVPLKLAPSAPLQ